jgi:hypothetical protein
VAETAGDYTGALRTEGTAYVYVAAGSEATLARVKDLLAGRFPVSGQMAPRATGDGLVEEGLYVCTLADPQAVEEHARG